jgi:hypothetical protein
LSRTSSLASKDVVRFARYGRRPRLKFSASTYLVTDAKRSVQCDQQRALARSAPHYGGLEPSAAMGSSGTGPVWRWPSMTLARLRLPVPGSGAGPVQGYLFRGPCVRVAAVTGTSVGIGRDGEQGSKSVVLFGPQDVDVHQSLEHLCDEERCGQSRKDGRPTNDDGHRPQECNRTHADPRGALGRTQNGHRPPAKRRPPD